MRNTKVAKKRRLEIAYWEGLGEGIRLAEKWWGKRRVRRRGRSGR